MYNIIAIALLPTILTSSPLPAAEAKKPKDNSVLSKSDKDAVFTLAEKEASQAQDLRRYMYSIQPKKE